MQLDLFTDQSACTYPGCEKPATHGANYYATGWTGMLYPASRDVTWIEMLDG